ncbi:hypothetical protein MKEN_00702800 [Mycena kentingensis (nom. inval.)]|nr:hypothetical protein MKEN_00702800 [Mycena kentingensis (nom. inval.)]
MAETLDPQTLAAASKLEVFDAEGKKVTFGSLYADKKTVVVFIRHFFCGVCKLYVEDLMQVPDSAFALADTKLVLIGCGEWKGIQPYHEMTGYKGPIYADPSRKLYSLLGLVQNLKMTPEGKTRPSYLKMSRFQNLIFSIRTGYMSYPFLTFSAGKWSQNGGEFVLGRGNNCSFIHRMQNTEDHTEVVDLMRHAGVEYTPA